MLEPTPLLLRQMLSPDFRPTNAACRKPPHTYRILILGDSYAYGLGVEAHENLAGRIQTLLGSSQWPSSVEVVNLGRPGFNLIKEWALLRQLEAQVEYDLLLLCLSADDAHPWSRQELAGRSASWEADWRLQWHPAQTPLKHVWSVLHDMARTQSENHRAFVVAYYDPTAAANELPMMVLPDVCAALGIPFLDLATPFLRFRPEQLRVSSVDAHPSAFAHRIAAVEAVRFLARRLPAPESAAPSHLERKARERIEAYQALDDAQGAPGALALRHLLESGAPYPDADPGIWSALDLCCRLWNRAYGLSQLSAYLDTIQLEIGLLNEQIAGLERYLLLTALQVEGLRSDTVLTTSLVSLSAASDDLLRKLMELKQNGGVLPEMEPSLSPEAPDTPEEGRTGTDILPALQGLCWQADSYRVQQEGGYDIARRPLEAVCNNLLALPRRHPGNLTGEAEAAALAQTISNALNAVTAELDRNDAMFQLHCHTTLAVEVRVPPANSAAYISLVCTYGVQHPYRCRYRQCQYVIADGAARMYVFDLPEGTTGAADVEMSFCYGVDDAVTVTGEEYILSTVLNSGAIRQPYKPGTLLYSPFSVERPDMETVTPRALSIK